MKRNVTESVVLGVILTGLSYAVGIVLGWIHSVNYLEAFAVFTSYSCTYLCVKERRINYPIGALSTAAYCVLFFQQGLVASAILNAYLTPSLLYGWFRWRDDSETRPVSRVALKMIPVYLAVTGIAYLGVLAITQTIGATMALTDSMILIGSIIAQFLLDNKKIESWYVWLVVNGFAIFTYFSSGLPLAGFQYIFFFANTFYGLHVWNRSRRAQSICTNDSIATDNRPFGLDSVRPVTS